WQRLLEVVEKTPVTLVMREGARITSERGAAA
ncbi:OsmC family peroxiredoxin, partial [Stenotrophomonas sp. A3_2]